MSAAVSLNELAADLDHFIVGDDLDYHEDQEPPVIVDLDQADRLLRRIARLEGDLKRLTKLADARKAQIDEWLAERSVVIRRELNWFVRSLEAWTRATHDEGGPQTHKLPAGTVQLRKAAPRLDVDETVEPRWARTRTSWDKTAAKKATEIGPELPATVAASPGYTAHAAIDPSTGEVIEGLTYLVPVAPSFSYRSGGGQS